MKKTNTTYLPLIIAAISLSLCYLIWSIWPMQAKDSRLDKQQVNLSETKINTEVEAGDGYIPFTQESFDSQKSKRRVLFFYAGWCTTCRPVNAEFLQDSNKIPEDVVVFRVNFRDSDTDEAEKMLAEKYKITYQHTFVQVNQDGEVISKWNGGNLAELIKNVN